MLRVIRIWWCAYRGHPYSTTTVPIVGLSPWQPEADTTYCNGCGAKLYTEFTDSAGTERCLK